MNDASLRPALRKTVDAVVVGAGFGGLYMLHKLRGIGASAILFEAGGDVGGTWYWNSYPGARCDVPSLAYSYFFDPELRKDWSWPERYSNQPAILAYARHVADRYDLRRDMVFDTRVSAAAWDEGERRWRVETDRGDVVSAKYLISAVGSLSATFTPPVPGLETFRGEWRHTGNFARGGLDVAGKRVALIGTGSSGIQAAPVLARSAAELTVFQRTPQFSIPAQNAALTEEYAEAFEASYEALRAARKAEPRPYFEGSYPKSWRDEAPQERQARYEALWDMGGPSFNFAYRDTMTDIEANTEAAEFLRSKIRSIVQDPETAERLCPKTYPMGTKRMCVDSGYYQTFNLPHVSLVDVRADPIVQVTPTGLRLASGRDFEADVIVFATGYDALTGSIERLNVRGRDGRRLQDAWREGPRSYFGLAVEGFPNFFIVSGPGSPSVLAVVITGNELQADWIADLVATARDQGIESVEAMADYQDRWTSDCDMLARGTLYPQADSWYMGANVPGKPRMFMPYLGGLERYRSLIERSRDRGYEGFVLTRSA